MLSILYIFLLSFVAFLFITMFAMTFVMTSSYLTVSSTKSSPVDEFSSSTAIHFLKW